MTKSDIVTDLRLALALLTRLPLPHLPNSAFAHQARAGWAFPVAGVVVGLLAMAVGLAALALGLSTSLAAGLVLGVQVMATGAMHEDGLADSADGLWGGWTRARRLEIMKDSQIGTYGVLSLILSLGLRWQALGLILAAEPLALPVIAALSRAPLPMMMARMPNARQSGLSQSVGQPPVTSALIAMLGAGLLAIVTLGGTIFWPLVGALIGIGIVMRIATRKIGGQTGDILGATQQVTEICLLLGLVAVI